MLKPTIQRIAHVNEADAGGGAQLIARTMMHAARSAGRESWLIVNRKLSSDPHVIEIPPSGFGPRPWRYACLRASRSIAKLPIRGAARLSHLLELAERPRDAVDWTLGREPFHRPQSRNLLSLLPAVPDVLHFHNLHYGYFDLRSLPQYSNDVLSVLTLHDEWLLTGHCACTMGCERWRTGCGACPDLDRYPHIYRDNTAANWRLKSEIYERSQLAVATPSRWLMERVEASMLSSALIDQRVIPNGINTEQFGVQHREQARAALNLPAEATILLFVASSMRTNVYKDYPTVRQAARLITDTLAPRPVVLLALGDSGPDPEAIGVDVRFVELTDNAEVIRTCYCAADLYLHAARSDNFPTTVLEALASGLPVVATAVGGIPEQVRSLSLPGSKAEISVADVSTATGTLVPPADPARMAMAAVAVLTDEELRLQLSANAFRDARLRFDLRIQNELYLDWYEELMADREARRLENASQ